MLTLLREMVNNSQDATRCTRAFDELAAFVETCDDVDALRDLADQAAMVIESADGSLIWAAGSAPSDVQRWKAEKEQAKRVLHLLASREVSPAYEPAVVVHDDLEIVRSPIPTATQTADPQSHRPGWLARRLGR